MRPSITDYNNCQVSKVGQYEALLLVLTALKLLLLLQVTASQGLSACTRMLWRIQKGWKAITASNVIL